MQVTSILLAPVAEYARRSSTQAPDEKVIVQRFINVVENQASIVKQNVRSLWAACMGQGLVARVAPIAIGA